MKELQSGCNFINEFILIINEAGAISIHLVVIGSGRDNNISHKAINW